MQKSNYRDRFEEGDDVKISYLSYRTGDRLERKAKITKIWPEQFSVAGNYITVKIEKGTKWTVGKHIVSYHSQDSTTPLGTQPEVCPVEG